MSDEIIWENQDVDLMEYSYNPIPTINAVARICYYKTDVFKIEPEEQRRFVKKLIEKGHESPLEFTDYIWRITTSRAISNELVRHRLASYMQESTRYTKIDELHMIRPEKPVSSTMEERLLGMFLQYQSMIKNGTRKEEARDMLPLGMVTHLYCKMNLREFRHFLKLRLDKAAHPQMRELARKMLREVKQLIDNDAYEVMFYDIGH